MSVAAVDKHSEPPPVGLPPGLTKYWYQRRRLFHKFDEGIQLDEESWFSVSPEQVADHVSSQVGRLLQRIQQQQQQQRLQHHASHPPASFVMLDAFCGCGGNAISFAKCLGGGGCGGGGGGGPPLLGLVVAVDMDRKKLRKAAHNASIYRIPKDRIVFVEANVLFLLEHVYRNGEFVLDRPLDDPMAAAALMKAFPPPVPTELVDGYCVGGIDLLPRNISLVHLDPPWGGVEYHVLGKNGYDLKRNMKIQRPAATAASSSSSPLGAGGEAGSVAAAAEPNGELHNDFFDSFCSASDSYHHHHHHHHHGASSVSKKQQRKARFNAELSDEDCVNGEGLLRLAASACETRIVTFDVPRNTNRTSLGLSAYGAGYRGNCRLEEQFLNGRLKTVTAYFGSDWSDLVVSSSSRPTEVSGNNHQEARNGSH
jgi:trimethylguanosine synthase